MRLSGTNLLDAKKREYFSKFDNEADPDRPKLVPREHWDGLPVPEAAPAPDLPSRLD